MLLFCPLGICAFSTAMASPLFNSLYQGKNHGAGSFSYPAQGSALVPLSQEVLWTYVTLVCI